MRNAARIVSLFFVSMGMAKLVRSALGDLSRLERFTLLAAGMFIVGLVGFTFGYLAAHPREKGTPTAN